MDILKNFGVDPILLAAQIVNFLIIFWLLKRFAYKPIFAMLEKRKRLIEEGVTNAQKSEEVLNEALEKEKNILKKAQTASEQLLLDAQKQAQEVLHTAEEHAKVRVEKILDDAKKEIDEQRQEAEKQLSKHTAQLAVDLLGKYLSSVVDSKTQKEVVEKVAKKLKA